MPRSLLLACLFVGVTLGGFAQAMAPQQKSTYVSAGTTMHKEIDMVTLVKQLDIDGQKQLVVFDKNGRGWLFPLKKTVSGEKITITAAKPMELGVGVGTNVFAFHNIFLTHQNDGEKLLVGYEQTHNNLYIFRLADGERGSWRTVHLPHSFELDQLDDGRLIMTDRAAGTSVQISLYWSPTVPKNALDSYSAGITYKDTKKSCYSWVIQRELVVNKSMIKNQEHREFIHKLIGPTSCTCFHKTAENIIFLGYDYGKIDVLVQS